MQLYCDDVNAVLKSGHFYSRGFSPRHNMMLVAQGCTKRLGGTKPRLNFPDKGIAKNNICKCVF